MPLPVADEMCPATWLKAKLAFAKTDRSDSAPSLVAHGLRRRWVRGLRWDTPLGAADLI